MLDNNGLSKYIQITKCGLPLISIYYLGGYTFYLSGQPSPDVSLQGAGGNVEQSQVTLRNNTAVSPEFKTRSRVLRAYPTTEVTGIAR